MDPLYYRLLALPGTSEERKWLQDRLEVLSAKESIVLAAALQRSSPTTAEGLINHLCSLRDYEVYSPAGSYAELGQTYMKHEIRNYEEHLPFVNLTVVGQMFEDKCPGLFIGDCYVAYPKTLTVAYDGTELPRDDDWSVRLKLSSPSRREGVWVSLPDYTEANGGRPDEVVLALKELSVDKVQDCMLLDARCVLPQAGNILEQYHSIADLIYDGNDLGFVLDEQGQGIPNFMDKFLGALKYEECDSLRFALDIAQNLHCYDWTPFESLEELTRSDLAGRGMPEEFVKGGCVDLEAYALDLLERRGCVMADSENGFISRNGEPFHHERTVQRGYDIQMQ